MALIRNVQVSTCGIDTLALSTSGVAPCIVFVIVLEDKIFIDHVSSENFNASSTCSINDAHSFLMNTFNRLHQLEPSPMIQNIFIVGGWNNNNFITLKSKINFICNQCNTRMEENSSLPPHEFDLFLSKIKWNLIGFNLPAKNSDGTDKDDDDDDDPNTYIVDFTLVYDRSSTPHRFIIWQYAGREEELFNTRSDSLIQAIYEFNPISKDFRACICSNANSLPHYDDFFKLVLLNVGNPQFIYPSFNSDYFKNIFNNLLLRVEQASLF
ncbi:unnamed protein product [Rotaria sp. Silwood1]|nr:unnamed protein product [Rotaria sp. Silwood1]CAF1642999.1 unnamed protein product [Rotaria sp. Silwood1]CAF3848446.1 unnamed protein product [Rotaria sp. Silwood1]CAF3951984.1 unnamed protein product [Rotaria sp. Silwood1]CAF4870052.1 unnamed protein product [Rotaria sp. Silwood1]